MLVVYAAVLALFVSLTITAMAKLRSIEKKYLNLLNIQDECRAKNFFLQSRCTELEVKEKARMEAQENTVLNGVLNKFHRQTEKGLRKYPNTVNPDDYTLEEWLHHMQEEAIDLVVYAETTLKKLEAEK